MSTHRKTYLSPTFPLPKFFKGDPAVTQVPLNSTFPNHFIPEGSRVTVVDVHPANGHVAYLVLDAQDHSALVDETALEPAPAMKPDR